MTTPSSAFLNRITSPASLQFLSSTSIVPISQQLKVTNANTTTTMRFSTITNALAAVFKTAVEWPDRARREGKTAAPEAAKIEKKAFWEPAAEITFIVGRTRRVDKWPHDRFERTSYTLSRAELAALDLSAPVLLNADIYNLPGIEVLAFETFLAWLDQADRRRLPVVGGLSDKKKKKMEEQLAELAALLGVEELRVAVRGASE
ncbi:hypothetical protein BU16DRAFT_567390 [Lophium mytilinum]|uniref:Uncharacterized protein n=1 Tax=Lophium mytilinum TaxID=390894 RepID=A0A6A6QAE5_9PEZI|nr:hypothetical protein BU16DRAFT_567390 [Lophium mytilinum]